MKDCPPPFPLRGYLFLLPLLLLSPLPVRGAEDGKDGKIEISSSPMFYRPTNVAAAGTGRLIEFMQNHPEVKMKQWGGIELPGGAGRAPLMMSIAGKTAPDIMYTWFHLIRNDIRQGFLYPLNEWIGEDTNGNGQIDLEEAKWEGWKNIHPLWRHVATVDGKVYGLPVAYTNYMGIVFRADMVRSAGLNPNRPPETWEELVYWCQKLTDPRKKVVGAVVEKGQRGICLPTSGWQWLPWLQSTGGTAVVQVRKSPNTGKEYVFRPDATEFVTPEGENLAAVESEWRASFASEAGKRAMGFYHRLRWMRWLIDPQTQEPVTLTPEDRANGFVMVEGRKLAFAPEDVIEGVARADTRQRGLSSIDLMSRGEVAMMPFIVDDLNQVGARLGLDPVLLRWFPFPAGPGPDGKRMVMKFNHYGGLCESVSGRDKRDRDMIWKALVACTDTVARKYYVREKVLAGLARFVNPLLLKEYGYDEYLKDIPVNIQENFEKIAAGEIGTATEPYMGFWITADEAISRHVISLSLAQEGEDFPYGEALERVEETANSGIMFGYPKEVLDKYRPYARTIFAVVAILLVTFVVLIIRTHLRKVEAKTKQVYSGWVPWAMIAPALILIGLWAYYPLLRGMVMAFQDYKITGNSPFVGLDNFIQLGLDASFWESLGRTVYFVLLNMLLAFCTPIFLAILLSEVPKGKMFYRTLFFLPQISSGLVIALLWKLMYEPTPNGFLNRILDIVNMLPLIHIEHQTWLQDSSLAMICCIVPTVWASMGMASLIYLAALKAVPEDTYEAAEVDGGGIFVKLRHITLPTLLPLIIINFVGTFVATFQNMGNIFLLTFGGPGDATMVVGLRIWIEAYNNLRFSMATSMAWVLGALLISFTYMQIRFLRRVEFKKAEWD